VAFFICLPPLATQFINLSEKVHDENCFDIIKIKDKMLMT